MDFIIGQVCWFAFNFVPKGWIACQGQLLSVSEHPSLYSLLGTAYGGDGRTTFGIPNLQGKTSMGQGSTDDGRFQMGETSPTTYAATTSSSGDARVSGDLVLNPCICLEGVYPSRS